MIPTTVQTYELYYPEKLRAVTRARRTRVIALMISANVKYATDLSHSTISRSMEMGIAALPWVESHTVTVMSALIIPVAIATAGVVTVSPSPALPHLVQVPQYLQSLALILWL